MWFNYYMNRNERPNVSTVTDEQLAAWGFPVEKTDKIMGTTVVVRPGMKRTKAVMAAWGAGRVRMAVAPAPVGNRTWADENGSRKVHGVDPEMVAFFGARVA